MLDALRLMFVLYGAIGVAVGLLYSRFPRVRDAKQPAVPLGPSRGIGVEAGRPVQRRFVRRRLHHQLAARAVAVRALRLSLTAAGAFFFWTGLLSAVSQLAAAPLARRIGLVNTMVFTHLPANFCLIAAAFAAAPSRARAAARAQPAVADGRAGAQRLRDVGGDAGRAAGGSGAPPPCRAASHRRSALATGVMFAAGAMATPLVAGREESAYDVGTASHVSGAAGLKPGPGRSQLVDRADQLGTPSAMRVRGFVATAASTSEHCSAARSFSCPKDRLSGSAMRCVQRALRASWTAPPRRDLMAEDDANGATAGALHRGDDVARDAHDEQRRSARRTQWSGATGSLRWWRRALAPSAQRGFLHLKPNPPNFSHPHPPLCRRGAGSRFGPEGSSEGSLC